MFKKILLLSLCIILIIAGIILVCNGKTSIVGTWKTDVTVLGLSETQSSEAVLTFNKDGTAVFKNNIDNGNTADIEFEYVINDNSITVLSANGVTLEDESYIYEIQNNVLTIFVGKRKVEYNKAD